MFALRDSRVARLLWNGADLAVEFATLGEYRLPDNGGVGAVSAGRSADRRLACQERPRRRAYPRPAACVQQAD